MPLIDPMIDDSEFNSSGEQNPVLFLDLRHVLEIRAVRTMQEQDADVHAFTGSHPDTMLASVKASRQVPGVRASDFPSAQLVGLFGFLAVGFGEFLLFAGLRLPINRVRCRVAVRLPRIGRRLRLRVLWRSTLRWFLLRGVGVGGVSVVRHPCPFLILLPVRASIR